MDGHLYRLYSRNELKSNRENVIRFHEELRLNGYVYIESTPDIDEIMKHLLIVSQRFFSMSFELKNNFTKRMEGSKNGGWANLFNSSCIGQTTKRINNYSGKYTKKIDPNPREYYDVRYGCENLVDSDFELHANKGFELFNDLSWQYLQQILYPLGVDESYVSDITYSGSDNLTGMKLLKYTYKGETDKETCLRHTDRGLLTISYCLDSGLTAKDFQTHQWRDIEASAPCRPCLLLFTGETLSRLTGGYFKAVLHKVVSKTDRYSFPFFYRARTPAVIDMTLLKSPVLNELLHRGELEAYPPIAVKDLDDITKIQYYDRVVPLQLGKFKSESYWSFNDDEAEENNNERN